MHNSIPQPSFLIYVNALLQATTGTFASPAPSTNYQIFGLGTEANGHEANGVTSKQSTFQPKRKTNVECLDVTSIHSFDVTPIHSFIKILVISLTAALLFVTSTIAGEASSLKSNSLLFSTNLSESDTYSDSSLVSFTPLIPLVDAPTMVATNGLECKLYMRSDGRMNMIPPICYVYVYNKSTNDMGCLNMPPTNLCRIALVDKSGREVEKTNLGRMYGALLTQKRIEEWRVQKRPKTGPGSPSIFIRFVRNGIPEDSDMPTAICCFSVSEAFAITASGEYELHLQMRLVQIGKDRFGTAHYPVTWLPEAVIKVQIR